jgi:hypothetical protein
MLYFLKAGNSFSFEMVFTPEIALYKTTEKKAQLQPLNKLPPVISFGI